MSPEQFYDAYITSGIDEYLERYFKEVCMEYVGLLNLIGKLPMKISKMGTWIGKEGNIDIIAQNSVRENIVGYCNWNQPEFTMEMKEELLKSMKQAKIDAKYFFLFSMYPSFLPDTPRIRANSCATLGFSVIINDFAKKMEVRGSSFSYERLQI